MMLHRSTMKMLSDLISPKALERILSDAARERHTTLSALDQATLQDILKRDIYKRLQLTVPAALAKRRVQEVLDSLGQEHTETAAVSSHSTQIVTLEEQAKQFALYFDWPETQRLRAVLSVARQTTAEGRDAETLLLEGSELVESLGRKLSEGLVTQGQDLSELKASTSRLSGVGGPKVKRLETLIKQISEAQDSRTLLPAEVERALALTLTLRKQIESSVVQQLGSDKREMVESLHPNDPGDARPFDLSQLTPEAQMRVQALEREHELRLLTELSREYAALLRLYPPLEQELQGMKDRSQGVQSQGVQPQGAEVLGEAAIGALREHLAAARSEAATQQQGQLDELAGRLAALSEYGHEPQADTQNDDAVQVARQGLSLAQVTLQAGGLITDEVAQLSDLVGTLENSDLQVRERLMTLQRESFELERRAREVPGAIADLTPLLEQARATLASGQVADLEPLWDILERRMGEAALQRESMDSRAARVMQDYDRYRHLAGETIQKLGRLADVLRGQQRLGVLSSDARGRYLQTLESAEALLAEAEAEFQAAREVTATFGADALSDLLGVFDSDAFEGHDAAVNLLSTVSLPPAPAQLTSPLLPAPPSEPAPSPDPFGLGDLLSPATAPPSSPLMVAEMNFAASGHAPDPEQHSSAIVRTWLVERGQVTQGDLSPAGEWRTETDCEADVLRLAWLLGQAAELHPIRLCLEMAGQTWLALPLPAGRALVACGPDALSAAEALRGWEQASPQVSGD